SPRRLARRCRAGRALWAAPGPTECRVLGDGDRDARTGHRRDHGDVQRLRYSTHSPPALRRGPPSRHDLGLYGGDPPPLGTPPHPPGMGPRGPAPNRLSPRPPNTAFTDLASSQPGDATLSGDGDPEQVPARKVTWNFWSVLGRQPALGRAFTEDEDKNGVRVVVISHGLWQRRFGGASDIIGRRISVNDEAYAVVGVMPRDFYFIPSRDVDIWLPASLPPWLRR